MQSFVFYFLLTVIGCWGPLSAENFEKEQRDLLVDVIRSEAEAIIGITTGLGLIETGNIALGATAVTGGIIAQVNALEQASQTVISAL